jgi:small subunit ribosomal protein S7
MVDGKKSVAERIFYDAMKTVEEKSGQPAINVFRQAISNAKPTLEVKSRRVGGATYQVPVEVRPERRQALAIKWMVSFARSRGERTMTDKLAAEILSASRNEGSTIKKKDDTHRMAEANNAFAHNRW